MSARRDQPPEPYLLRPEWYQVTYNLAAQNAHHALPPPRRRKRRVQPLSDPFGDHDEPREDVPEDAIVAAATAARELALGAALTLEHAAAASRMRRRRAPTPRRFRRPAAIQERALEINPELQAFLTETVEPAAVVLLGGVLLEQVIAAEANEKRATRLAYQQARRFSRRQLIEVLSDETRESLESADQLANYALAQDRRSYRADYNLACYFSRRAIIDDRDADRALALLQNAIKAAPLEQRAALAQWAKGDPSLDHLRTVRERQFYGFVGLFVLPTR